MLLLFLFSLSHFGGSGREKKDLFFSLSLFPEWDKDF